MFYAFNHPIYREVEYNELRQQVLYPPDVAALRNANISFTEPKSGLTVHQSGDFKLEERVKSMKRMSPKGPINENMWRRIGRSHDEVNEVVSNTMEHLKLLEVDRVRLTDIRKEINCYRAYLRHSTFLKADTDRAVNIRGEYLDNCMNNLAEAMREKRQLYYKMALDTPLENIRYQVLKTDSSDIQEEIRPRSEFLCDD